MLLSVLELTAKRFLDSKAEWFQFGGSVRFDFSDQIIFTYPFLKSPLRAFNLFLFVFLIVFSSASFAQPVEKNENIVTTNPTSSIDANTDYQSSNLKPVKVMVNWNHQFQFAGFYAAIAKGFYQKKRIKVQVLDWQPGRKDFEHLLDGSVDFGVAQNDVLIELARGAPLKLVMANFQYSPLILLSHKPLKSLSELSGARVMHNGSLQIKTLIQKAYLQTGIFSDVEPSSGNLQDFIDKKVDFYGAYNTNEPFVLKRKKVPYSIVDPKNYGVQSYDGLVITSTKLASENPELVSNFKEATIQGWKYALKHPEEIVDFIITHYPTQKNKQDMLNEAAALKEYVAPAPGMIGQIDVNKIEAVLSDAKKYLHSEYPPISEEILENFIFRSERLFLNEKERVFLKKNPTIRLGNASDWPPFDFFENKVYQGLAADYLQLISDQTGIKFEPNNVSWPEVFNLIEQGDPIVFPALVSSKSRNEQLYFTDPYIHFPLVLASYNKDGFINDFGKLIEHTVSVINKSWAHEYFKENYPKIDLFLVDNAKQGLESVLVGESLVYADNLAAINYTLKHEGFTDFNIVGRAEQTYQLSMAVNKEFPELFSIIQKSLSQISPLERDYLYEKWFPITMVNEYDTRTFWQVTAVLLSIIAIISLFLIILLKRQSYINSIYELSLATTIDFKTLKIIKTSHSFCELSGYSRNELIGKKYLELSKNKIPDPLVNEVVKTLKKGQPWHGEFPAIRKDGEEYWVALTMTPQKNLFNKVNRIVITRIDITNRKKVEQVSITDDLTGLFNRRKFNDILPSEINRAKREKANLALIMIDIDFFKKVNDEYGHDVGDEVLIEIATSLNSYFHRATDMIFRIGGEEFMVITHFDSIRALEVHINNLITYVRSLAIENRQAPLKVVTISAGAILCYPEHRMTDKNLMKKADQLLYKSKEAGRNTFHYLVIKDKE